MKHPFPLSSLMLAIAIAPAFPLAAQTAASQTAAPRVAPQPRIAPAPALPTVLNGVRETTLANGLKVLTKEVHSAPVTYFSIWYKAGSVNEQLGQSGMSHLLEHMLFKGTKTRKPGEISALLQQNGAQFNATTSFDRTNYFETLASDRVELAMQLEADRMQNSLFDAAEHQKEMSVVRSEYEGGENNPSSALTKAVRLAAHQVHPYRWMTIGFRADIENISRDEMFDYYQRYYVPNNAVIVMVGDFDTGAALAQVQRIFGGIPSRPVRQSFITPEPEQQGERRVIVRRAGSTKQVQIAYHIPEYMHPDRYAIDVLETVLSGGRTARFFGELVQSGLASRADAYDYGLRDPDLMFLDATAQPGRSNAELERALLAEIDKLQAAPIAGEELRRAVNQAEAAYIFGQDSVQSQGSQLGGNAMRGDWCYGETYLENLRRVTPADVQRVAKKYLVERNRTVGYFEPIAAPNAPVAAPSAPVVAPKRAVVNPAVASRVSQIEREIRAFARAPRLAPMPTGPLGPREFLSLEDLKSPEKVARFYRDLERNSLAPMLTGAFTPQKSYKTKDVEALIKELQRAKNSRSPFAPIPTRPFARALSRPLAAPTVRANAQMQPRAASNSASTVAKKTRLTLPNGLTVIIQENHANPTVALSGALLSAGGVFDPQDKPGLAAFTASQLSRGTKTRSLLDIARTLEGVGASVGINGGLEYASISGRALSRDFDAMLDVLADELRNPSFPADEIEKSRRQTLAGLEAARQDTGTLGRIAFMNALYPLGHPYHQPTLDESTAVIQALKREDLVAFHAAKYAPDRLILTLVGDIAPDKAIASLNRAFGDWPKKGDLPAISIADVAAGSGKAASANGSKPLVIPLADKAQADVIYGYPAGLKRSDPDFYRVVVLNTMLGSGLASRLALSVRDRLGLVYGIGAGTEATLGAGPFSVGFGANPGNVDQAVAETRRQLELARDKGFTKAEVERAVAYITGSYAVTLSTNAAVAGQLLVGEIYGLGPDYIQKRNGYYRAVTVDEVNAAAAKYLDPALGTLVIAGSYAAK